jgi:putative membrane protein
VSVAVFGVVAVSGRASAQAPGGMGGGMGGGFGLLWLVVLIGLVAVAVGAFRSHSLPSAKADTAMETLRRRYARGEVSEEEFARRRESLRRQR